MISSLILLALMVVAAGVYGQATDKEKKNSKTECKFIDKNKDGKCDTCGATADKCKDACKAKEGKDCSKCPSSATCGEHKDGVVPAGEAKEGTPPPCCAKKK